MIEDALLEAQKLDEGAVTNLAGKAIQGVKNMFSGGNKNGVQQGQPQNGGGQTTQQDGGAQQQKEAADPGIDKIKQYLNDNDDISDWPADRLGELIAFLKTQNVFMNSKTAQAELQAIQQQENEAKAEGKVSADNESKPEQKGDASKITKDGDKNVVNTYIDTAVQKLQSSINGISRDDVIAYIKTL